MKIALANKRLDCEAEPSGFYIARLKVCRTGDMKFIFSVISSASLLRLGYSAIAYRAYPGRGPRAY